MLQPIVGEVAERLDIKHNPASAYANARDKYATRQVSSLLIEGPLLSLDVRRTFVMSCAVHSPCNASSCVQRG